MIDTSTQIKRVTDSHFADWLCQVDVVLLGAYDITINDVDGFWWDASYENGSTPEQAADLAVQSL